MTFVARAGDADLCWLSGFQDPEAFHGINRPRQGLCLNTRPSFLRVARHPSGGAHFPQAGLKAGDDVLSYIGVLQAHAGSREGLSPLSMKS